MFAQSLMNLDDVKKAVKNYYESGAYAEEVKAVIDSAENELAKLRLAKNSVVVFDIDDTILSGYEYTESMGFGFTFETWKNHILQAEQESVPHIKEFYDFILNRGLKIVFITGRSSVFYNATKINLQRNGFNNYDTLICRNLEEEKLSAVVYKNIKRRELTDNGYKIIATIGDQLSDLEGDNTGIKIKLPNYLYKID